MARYKRRRRNKTLPKYVYWVSYVLFAILIALLGYALYTGQTPITVYEQARNKIFRPGIPGHLALLSKKELTLLIQQKDSIITELQRELDERSDSLLYSVSYIDVQTDALNMRQSANLASEVITRIPHRTPVRIIEKSTRLEVLEGATGYWMKVDYNGQEGWVWGNYLSDRPPN